MLKVSVVVQLLMKENIEQCLRSIKIDIKPYEIILGDGGSIDRTRQIAKRYVDRVAISKLRGSSVQRHAAAKIAKGKIIAFIDSDSFADSKLAEKNRGI